MKNKTKKFMAMLLLVLTLCSSLPLNSFATFITNINSNATFGVISGSLNSYGHELHYANYDGTNYITFCTQYGQTSPTGKEYTYNGDFLAQYKNDRPQYEKIAEMIYFGYAMNYGMGLPSSTEAKRAACATQQYVWEYIHNYIDGSAKVPSRDSWNSNYMSSSIYSNWLAQTENYYNQYYKDVSFNKTNNKIVIGEATTLTDTNGVLQHYASFNKTINGVNFSHDSGSNDLRITTSSESSEKVTFDSSDYGLYELMPNGSEYVSSNMSNYVYFKFTSGAIQDLIFSNYVDPSRFVVSVEVESGNVLIIKTNTTGDAVAGCTFDLYKDAKCTQKIGSGTTDANGQLKFEKLATGTVYCKETSVPTGYLLDTSIQKTVVKNGETAEVTFKNNEPTGEITITKTDKETGNSNRVDGTSHHGDASIKGAVYTLYADKDIYNVSKSVKYFSKDEEVATFTFDEYGNATINITNKNTKANLSVSGNTIKGLPMGSFYSLETSVPDGYTKDTNKYTYTLNYKDMNTPVIKTSGVVENTVQKAKFEVIKISSNTNTTAPVIEGAEFTAILTKYVDYYGSFDEALKHLDEYAEDEYSVFKTGSDGHGVSGLLAYGEYTVYETYTPSDEINTVVPFYIKIDKNSDGVIKEFIENDTPFPSYLKMVKIDKKTGKKVTFSNATFSLYKLNSETNEWEKVKCKTGKETVDKWTTDESGIAYTETKLTAGKYKLEEISIPNGFLQLDEDVIFEINKSNKTLEFDEDYDAYITVTVGNEQPTGTLVIDKSVAIRDDINTSLVDISDLSGIEFKLTAKEDILDMSDGSIIYKKGQEVGTYNLDKDGNLTIDSLPMGKYELLETATIDGVVLNSEKYDIEFTQEDTFTKVYTNKEEIINDTTCVEFSKTDITGDTELVGATLTVTDKDGNVIDKWISGDKTHKIEGLKVGETYTLKEEIQVEDYVKATDIEFTVKNTKEIQKVTMVDKVVDMSKVDIGGNEIEGATIQVIDKDNNVIDEWISGKEPHKIKNLVEGETYTLHEEITVDSFVKATDMEFTVTYEKETQHLEMIDKIVEIVKTDLVTGDEIEGAELQVVDENGNIVDEWTSTKEPHKVVGLEEGKTYTLIEKTCPYGYEQAEEIEFTVTKNKETQKVEMKDMPILTDIRVIKIDSATHETIKDKFTFGIYTDEECTKLIQQVDADTEDGYVDFKDLRYGIFYIKELSSPKYYQLSDKIVKVEINDKGVFVDNEQIEKDENDIYSFEFENVKIETPNTGDNSNMNLWIALLAMSAVSLIGIGAYEYKKRKIVKK